MYLQYNPVLKGLKALQGYRFCICMYLLFKNKQLVCIALFVEQSLLPLKPLLITLIC